MALNGQSTDQAALLDAELELWTTTFSYIKSMALKSALDLKLADAIHHHGGAATLPQITTRVDIHPSKIPCLRRLMRTLTASGVFTLQPNAADPAAASGEPLYALTPSSQLLVSSRPRNLASIMAMLLNPALVTPFLEIGSWFRHPLPDPCIFSHTHGEALWDMAGRDAGFDALINDGMVSDSRFIMDVAVRECGQVFEGVGSLVDVGGGLGAASQVISKAFPRLKCSVMDLGHVVARAPSGTNVKYVAGDMFESVPPADAVFLKSVLHDWGDEECVKILKKCKKAIRPREDGGKVIIIDIVIRSGPSGTKHKEMQTLFDLYIMFVNGIERDEQEWKKIFLEAGFSGYKIMPVLGFRSIIELVLHDWGDDECVKILKNCKKAIPSRENGGKVIIFDTVVGAGPSAVKRREMHALFDLYIMLVNGIERDEQEWEKIFLEAGFSSYKIMPVLGFRSIIEVYP